ncbi:RsmB/NOP family class I SAM-dependent RNA methyltransferase [Palaeococcus ferrophilus]|uniref:RsmB/NOP family class I SAM-dependent RNA methyltransferase n=1 Tax=Palaeococcus ferrophilus TaxID=83868 RepID=UPI00064F06E5|nr:RsmB/NOP family class I SAM-dependent RNA methyltransferase [Palaeococcus ferrophilus]
MEITIKLTLQEFIAEILTEIEELNLSAKHALERAFRNVVERERFRPIVHSYVFEILKWKKRIDFTINSVLRGSTLENLPPFLANLMRIGVYDMKYRKTPAPIATDSVVRVVRKRYGSKRAKFVNAVLRSVEGFNEEKALRKLKERDPIEYLSVKFSHPRWYVEYAIELLGRDRAIALMISNNRPQRYYVRVNPLKTDIDSLRDYLEENGVRTALTPLDDVLKVLDYDTPLTRLKWYRGGYFVIQDLASAYVAHVLAPEKGELILDLAAAPGSKTFHMAHLMENTGKIIAVDYSRDRLERMREKMKLLGIKNVELVHADGQSFRWREKFDKVLLDAPCSSSGTYRQFPDVKWSFDEEKIRKVISVQRNMLLNAYENLREGGEMTYSTCSIRVDEDEENVKFALRKGFELVDYPFSWGSRGFTEIGERVFRAWTHEHDCNSFFIAKLRKP